MTKTSAPSGLPTWSKYSGYNVDTLQPTCVSLAEALLTMETSELKAIYKKYLQKARFRMSEAVSTKYQNSLEIVSRGL
jgi:hypothetical protein